MIYTFFVFSTQQVTLPIKKDTLRSLTDVLHFHAIGQGRVPYQPTVGRGPHT